MVFLADNPEHAPQQTGGPSQAVPDMSPAEADRRHAEGDSRDLRWVLQELKDIIHDQREPAECAIAQGGFGGYSRRRP